MYTESVDHDDRMQNQIFHSGSKLVVNKLLYFRVWKHKISEKNRSFYDLEIFIESLRVNA